MIWVDITNLPHVLFFKDFISKHNALVTTRKLDGLTKLLEMHKINYISVGKHGKNKKSKLVESSKRIKRLVEIISKHEIELAIAKHSVELPRVAFGLGIPCFQVVDNEYAEKQNRLFLSLCDKIIVPEALDEKKLIKQGADKEKIIKFNGICEYVHIKGFSPSKPLINEEYVLVRPEPFYASYFRSRRRTQELINEINQLGYKAVVMPRGNEKYKNVIHVKAVDSLNLIYHAQAFAGGGGTMNREASLLGTPTISFYPQELLGVDKFLIKKGLLFHAHELEEISENILELVERKEELRKKAKKVMQNMQDPIEVIERAMHEDNISKEWREKS